VVELTGRVRYRAQARALDFLRIPYRLRPDGSPLVVRAHVEGRVESREPQLRLKA
jgi:hypothetical protein